MKKTISVLLLLALVVSLTACGKKEPEAGEDYAAIKWIDYRNEDEMLWDEAREIELDEFPGVTFHWNSGTLAAIVDGEATALYGGMPIWSVYFCDLTGDGKPELCSTVSLGSGMIDERILIYDYANGTSYEKSDRGQFDYRLSLKNGRLVVEKRGCMQEELLASGELVFQDETYQIVWEE